MPFLRISSMTNRYITGRAAHGAERVWRASSSRVLERLGDQPHLAVPRCRPDGPPSDTGRSRVRCAPHLELVAEHHLGGRLRPVDDGDLAELAALVVDVVDEASAGGAIPRPPATSRMSWPFISSKGNPRPNGPRRPTMSPHCIRVQRLGEARPRAGRASSMKPALRRRARQWRWAPPPRRRCTAPTNCPGSCENAVADALVDEAELEQLLGGRQVGDGRDAGRPGPVRVRRHQLRTARERGGLVGERPHLDGGRPPAATEASSRPLPARRTSSTSMGLMSALQALDAAPAPHAEHPVVVGQKAVELVVHAVAHAASRPSGRKLWPPAT